MQKTIIQPQKGWHFIEWKEVYRYKDLLYFLVLRDVKAIYKQTILGFGWALIRPFVSMVIFTVIFGKFAGLEKTLEGGVPYAVFSYVALIPWMYFSGALSGATSSLIGGSGIFSKVYFPRIIIPLTPVIAKLVDFAISFSLLIALMFYYGISPNMNIIYLPILIIIMILTAMGIGMWLSALAIQYRDVQQLMGFLIQILMYVTPIIWPITLIPEKYRLIYGLYPMVGVIEGFRAAIIGKTAMPWEMIGLGFIVSLLMFLTGSIYFKYKERIFVDVA